jgi:hypothetical protein
VLGCGDKSPLFGVVPPITFDWLSSEDQGLPVERSRWKVVVQGKSSERDSLVITSIPLDNDKDRLTIFSGLHSAGTRAIDLLLKDDALLWQLMAKTRKMPAWQAIIEVKADGFENPLALGESAVFEFAKAKFDDPKLSIRKNMFIDLEAMTGVAGPASVEMRVAPKRSSDAREFELCKSDLYKTPTSAILSSEHPAAQRPAALPESHENQPIPSGKARRFREGAKRKPREHSEAKMSDVNAGLTAASTPQGHRGRPAKAKSEAVGCKFWSRPRTSSEIQFIQDHTSAESMGEVIRDAVRAEYERLALKKNQKRR